MTKRYLSTFLLLSALLPGMAKELTPEQALQRAKDDSPAFMARRAGKATPQLVHTSLSETGVPAIYIFNNAGGKGFMALSADDAAIPLLGYSDRWNFSADNMPPQLKWWLEEYGRQIDFARRNNLSSASFSRKISHSGERTAIEPMVKTMWDQIAPFNEQCPLSGSERTWTGCVATAMAQVMKYWDYPEKGTGSITYSIESIEKKVTLNFELKKFDWDNMLDAYIEGQYTQEEADAVAYLMKACGYSVKMQYSMDASGALGMNIGNALTKYFGYDGNLLYTLRQYYSSTEWDDMMYENLRNVGPVMYGGGSTLGGGHSFVCDGYDGEGLYHFNWGWSGMSDGYFALEALNPDALGTGGGGGGGYNFSQDAVFGIQPPTGQPVEERKAFLAQEGELSGTLSGNKLSFSLVNSEEAMWVNYNPTTLKVKFGAMFYPQGSEAQPIYHDISDKRVSLEPGYGTSPQVLSASIDLKSLNLADGTYKVVCGSVPVEQGALAPATDGTGFVEVKPRYGNPNYFILKVDNGKYSVDNALLPPLKIRGEIVGDLYYGMLTTVRVTVENTSDIERTSGFAPVFMDSEGPLLLGESICVSIPPKSTLTREWSTSLTQFVQYINPYLNTPLLFTFFDETGYDFYTNEFSQTVVMKENPGTPKIRVSQALTVEGSYTENNMMVIPNPNDIRISGELTLTSGYFNYPVVVCLCIPATNDQVEIINTASQNVLMTTDTEDSRKATLNLTMSNPLADPEQQYYFALTYQGMSGLVQLGNIIPVKFADPSGISDIESDSEPVISINRNADEAVVKATAPINSVNVFDITGRSVDTEISFNGHSATIKLPINGIYIISVKDEAGNEKAFKVN